MTEQTFAFVLGCPRSGTTALTQLLNRHPAVAIGTERFSGPARRRELTPAHYAPERFGRFEEGDTHHMGERQDRVQTAVLNRIATAPVIGDKLPQLIGKVDQLRAFPEPKLIFVLRNPFSVAESHDRRAARKRQTWGTDRDHRVAVRKFNGAIRQIAQLEKSRRFKHLVVPYEQLFSVGDGVSKIFEFLGLDPGKLSDTSDLFATSKARQRAGRGVSTSSQFVALRANFEGYKTAMSHALARLGLDDAYPDLRSTQ